MGYTHSLASHSRRENRVTLTAFGALAGLDLATMDVGDRCRCSRCGTIRNADKQAHRLEGHDGVGSGEERERHEGDEEERDAGVHGDERCGWDAKAGDVRRRRRAEGG